MMQNQKTMMEIIGQEDVEPQCRNKVSK